MTREETLHRFKRWCQQYIGNNCSDEDYHMANNIIALLEQEPCEDAISRKDFIAKIEDIYNGYMLDDGGCYPQNFVDLAEEMPSVQPKQRVAKWNKVPKEYI